MNSIYYTHIFTVYILYIYTYTTYMCSYIVLQNHILQLSNVYLSKYIYMFVYICIYLNVLFGKKHGFVKPDRRGT